MRQLTLDRIFNNLSKDYPNPSSELTYINRFTFLISVVLSAQATDVSVNKATKDLFKLVSTPQAMIRFWRRRIKKIY